MQPRLFIKPFRVKINNMALLMAADCLKSISYLFLSIFMVAYFFKISNQNVTAICVYYLIAFATIGLLAIASGDWLKRGNRLTFYRTGIILNFIYLCFIIVMQERIVHFLPLCAILYGLSQAPKDFSWNLMVADTVHKSDMIHFRGYLNTIKGIIKITAPFLLGYFLTFDSFVRTVAFLLFLVLTELTVSVLIKLPASKDKTPFNIVHFWKKNKSNTVVKHVVKMEFFNGLSLTGALSTVIILYTVYLFSTDFKLGLLTSLFNGVSILINLWFGKFCKYDKFGGIIVFAFSTIITASLLFTFVTNEITFIIYNFCFASAVKLLDLMTEINMFNTSNIKEIKTTYKNEYFAVRELCLCFGRLGSYGLLLIIGLFHQFDLLRYLLVLYTVFLGFMGLNSVHLNNRLLDEEAADFQGAPPSHPQPVCSAKQ